jgi:hypothetical protein
MREGKEIHWRIFVDVAWLSSMMVINSVRSQVKEIQDNAVVQIEEVGTFDF